MIVEKAKLKKALQKVNAFTSKDIVSTTPPRILFSAKDGKVDITSCNGVDFGRFSFDIDDKTEMSFVIENKNFMRATTLRGDPSIEYEKDCVEIRNGDTKMVFPAQSADTYPIDEYALVNDNRITIKSEELKRLVGKVSYCRNEKDSRLFLTGVKMSFDGETLSVESTDSLRIVSNSIKFDEKKDFTFEGILNQKAIGIIENLDDDKEVTLGMDDKSIYIEDGGNKVFSSLINAKYPDLSKFYNVTEEASFTLDKNQVLESLALFSMSENKSLVIEGEGDKVVLHQEDGISEIKDCIPLENFKGQKFMFCVDIDLFREVFANMREGSTKMKFIFEQSESPLKMFDEEQFVGIIQPLSI